MADDGEAEEVETDDELKAMGAPSNWAIDGAPLPSISRGRVAGRFCAWHSVLTHAPLSSGAEEVDTDDGIKQQASKGPPESVFCLWGKHAPHTVTRSTGACPNVS